MNPTLVRAAISSLALFVLAGGPACATPASNREVIGATIKAPVRDIVAGINTHNARERRACRTVS